MKKEGATPSAGVISQEVKEALPAAVSVGSNGMESVNYNALEADSAALKRDIEELRSAIGLGR